MFGLNRFCVIMAPYEDCLSNLSRIDIWQLKVPLKEGPLKWLVIKWDNAWNLVYSFWQSFGSNLLFFLTYTKKKNLLIFLVNKLRFMFGSLGVSLCWCSYMPTWGSGFIVCSKWCLYILPPFPVSPCNIFIYDFSMCSSQGFRISMADIGYSWGRGCEDEVTALTAGMIFN